MSYPDDDDDDRATYSPRAGQAPTTRAAGDYRAGQPIRQDWRSHRAQSGASMRARPRASPGNDFVLWLQGGGWKIAALVAGVVVLAVLALILVRPARPLATPSSATTPAAGIGRSALGTPLPSVTAGPTRPTSAPTFTASARFRVVNTGDEGLFLRPSPSTSNTPLKTLPDGTILTVIGEDVSAADRVWKHVRDPDGTEGYVARDYVQPVP
jgi:hypothetical protein